METQPTREPQDGSHPSTDPEEENIQQPAVPEINWELEKNRHVIVSGFPPKQRAEKIEALQKLARKTLEKTTFARSADEVKISFPMDGADEGENPVTVGVALMKCKSRSAARRLVSAMDGMTIAKEEAKAMLYSEYLAVLEARNSPSVPDVALQTREHVFDWALTAGHFEQLAIRANALFEPHNPDDDLPYISIYQPTPSSTGLEPKVVADSARQMEMRQQKGRKVLLGPDMQWSPRGSFLVEILPIVGITLNGGSNFERFAAFGHKGAKQCFFSMNEEYCVTVNPDSREVKVWSVLVKQTLFSFTARYHEAGVKSVLVDFSFDGAHLAALTEPHLITIFDVLTGKVVKEISMFTDGIPSDVFFQWCPNLPVLAAFRLAKTPKDSASKLVIHSLKEERTLRSSHFTEVRRAQLEWHPKGQYLAVLVELECKKSKKAKKKAIQFGIADVRDADASIPLEMSYLNYDRGFFAWDPESPRLAVALVEEPGKVSTPSAYSIRFVHPGGKQNISTEINTRKIVGLDPIDEGKKLPQQYATLPITQSVNCIAFSPGGCGLVFATRSPPDSPASSISFCVFNEKGDPEVVKKVEHKMTTVEWDASGRYVLTAMEESKCADRNISCGYSMWSHIGELLYRASDLKLIQVLWRPHPPRQMADKERKMPIPPVADLTRKYRAVDELAMREGEMAEASKRMELEETFDQVVESSYLDFCELAEFVSFGRALDLAINPPLQERLVQHIVDETESIPSDDEVDTLKNQGFAVVESC